MSRIDVSKLPMPSEEFMAGMRAYREVCRDKGKHSYEATVMMTFVLEHAAPEIVDRMRADCIRAGVLPAANQVDANGDPVFTFGDLAGYYCMDHQAACQAADRALSKACQ